MPIVNNKQARLMNLGDHVVLKPGNNDVPQEAWDKAKEIKVVQGLIKDGLLVEDDSSAAKTASGAKDLSGLTVPEAQKLIDETFDRELLGAWKKADDRKGVNDAIDAQLDLIKKAGEVETGASGAKK